MCYRQCLKSRKCIEWLGNIYNAFKHSIDYYSGTPYVSWAFYTMSSINTLSVTYIPSTANYHSLTVLLPATAVSSRPILQLYSASGFVTSSPSPNPGSIQESVQSHLPELRLFGRMQPKVPHVLGVNHSVTV